MFALKNPGPTLLCVSNHSNQYLLGIKRIMEEYDVMIAQFPQWLAMLDGALL